MKFVKWTVTATATAALMACGGGSDVTPGPTVDVSGAPGSLISTPAKLATLTPAQYVATPGTASLFAVAGTPKCTIDFHYIQYGTVGAVGEKTTASAGVMVPSGTDPACTGDRPVLLYAHGTTGDKNYNMASPATSEASLVAAMYAAQGYIVIAPNYAGYDSSTLPYHPYVIMDQQAKDMVDALAAARKGFAAVGAKANNKLFVAGYSQGGFVSMATQRALQLAGTPVTAAAHMSGSYATGRFADAIFGGNVIAGGTSLFAPLAFTSYQRAYGNIYSTPSDLYESKYVPGIETLLPSTTPNTIVSSGKLPELQMFAADSLPQPAGFGVFFGPNNLIKTSYRNAVLADVVANPTAPKHPLRVAAYKNDLLNQNWTPNRPMLMCGGSQDPSVFFAVNTTSSQAYFAARGVPAQAVTVLDLESAPTGATDPFVLAKGGFAQAKAATAAAGGAAAVLGTYHGGLVPPFCNAAARGYLSQF